MDKVTEHAVEGDDAELVENGFFSIAEAPS